MNSAALVCVFSTSTFMVYQVDENINTLYIEGNIHKTYLNEICNEDDILQVVSFAHTFEVSGTVINRI